MNLNLDGNLNLASNRLNGQAAKSGVVNKLAYTIKELCALTGICRTALYEAIKAGELPIVKRGWSTVCTR
jgi:excisionase family DNA binding protein